MLALSGQRLGDYVYLRLQIAQEANLHKPSTGGGIRIEVRADEETLTIDTEQRSAERDGQPVSWQAIDYVALPTHAATDFEIRLRASAGPLTIGISGSDTLKNPLILNDHSPAAPPRKVNVERGDAPLRIVSWNVLGGGPFNDPEREAAGRQVLQTLDADVLLLQEVWRIPDFEQRVRDLCGEEWTLHEMGGVAVVSRYPITLLEVGPPVELDNRRRPKGGDTWSLMRNLFVGIDTPAGPIVAISAHWKCCGSLGSGEDITRMDDALTALKAIWRLRDAGIPAEPWRDGSLPYKAPVPERFTDAPILFAGDYNLVGSRAPLDMLLTQGFTDLLPLQSDEWLAATWRTPNDDSNTADWEPGGFPPGRLDFALASPQLNVTRAFIADLGEPTLLSDHLPIVVDIGE